MEFIQVLLIIGVLMGGITTFDAFDDGEILKASVGFVMLAATISALVFVPGLKLVE